MSYEIEHEHIDNCNRMISFVKLSIKRAREELETMTGQEAEEFQRRIGLLERCIELSRWEMSNPYPGQYAAVSGKVH
jgi:hypothetical protein